LTIDILVKYVFEYRLRQFESASLDESESTALDREPLDDSWLDETLGLSGFDVSASGESGSIATSRKDAQRQALVSLRSLPTRWRRAVWFHYVDELPISHIAEALRMTTDDVEKALDASMGLLRERLLEQGVESLEDDWPAEYLVAPPTLSDTEQIAGELKRLVQNEKAIA
jgi:DNA-directed RNA polymerase specialized sigma24 family protein